MSHFQDTYLQASRVILGVPSTEEKTYVPLPLRQLVGDKEVPFDVYLKVKTQGHQEPHFVRCCARGQVFQRQWQRKMVELEIPWVYFHPDDEPVVLDYLNEQLGTSLASDRISHQEKAMLIYDVTLI